MNQVDQLKKLISEMERSAYQRGWDDAVAHILAAAAAKRQGQVSLTAAVLSPVEDDREAVIDRVFRLIHATPGQPGHMIVKAVHQELPSKDKKAISRTCRTALGRLKKRGKIEQRDNRWFPKGLV